MKRLHVSLIVNDLEDSKRFYSTLFAAEPTVIQPDYAKWMIADPRVNFSIVDGKARGKTDSSGIEHLGIQAETEQELAELRERIGRTAGPVDDEGEVTCCYHDSDKTWVQDGQGVSWEAFHTSGEASTFHGDSDDCCDSTCCAPAASDPQPDKAEAGLAQ